MAVKTFRGRPVRMGDKNVVLSDGVNLDMPISAAADVSGHLSVVLVENWEAFERIHKPKFSSWILISVNFGRCFHVISIR